jgi:hypothetical protein
MFAVLVTAALRGVEMEASAGTQQCAPRHPRMRPRAAARDAASNR